jgi:uncharacterized protein (DUF111 family)
VLDVVQSTVTGKKGRLAISVRVLCRADTIDPVIEACFLQTTTIGLRWRVEKRVELVRKNVDIAIGAREIGAKMVARPGARVTTKADMDALASQADDQPGRARARRVVEGRNDGDT